MNRFIVLLLSACTLCLAGCQSVRYRARESYPASGIGFQASQLEQEVSLKKGQPYALHALREAENQGLYYLQVAPGKKLPERYHHGQDLSLVGISGKAVVEVEGERYRVKKGTALIIPAEHAYSVIVSEDSSKFAGYLLFSPPYSVDAVELTGG